MANVLIYNVGNGRALEYKESVNTPDFSARPDVLVNPVMPPGVPIKFLKVVAGAPIEMTQGEKDTVTAGETAASDADLRTTSKTQLAALNESNLKLRACVIYLVQQIKVAVPAYNTPTKAQAITAIRAIIDNQSAD